jgi:predicted nucleic acid-binding protein
MVGIKVLVDTGPLVAYWSKRDRHHEWATDAWGALTEPVYCCEAVISETAFLLRDDGLSPEPLWAAIERGIVCVDFNFNLQHPDLLRLLRKYDDQPMSVADACLVRMSELSESCAIFTTDKDFSYYRRHGRGLIPLIAPFTN